MIGILVLLGMFMVYELLDKLIDIKNKKVNEETYIEVNNTRFYYNPNELKINNEILDKLNNFIPEDESAYSMYIDETQGLVIY
jgi:hypothetical protein